MTGNSKPGPAVADAIRDRQKPMQEDTREALRRLRESIADDDDRPSVEVHVHTNPKTDPTSLRNSLIPKSAKGIAVAVATILAALAALAKAISDALQ